MAWSSIVILLGLLIPSLRVYAIRLPSLPATLKEWKHESAGPLWHTTSKRQSADSLPQLISSRASGDDSSAGIQLAARQRLFDYATQQGLSVLRAKVQQLPIPDAQKSFDLPIIGSFELQLSEIKVHSFNLSSEDATLKIMEGFFHATVTEVDAELAFKWHWAKLGLSGSGDGTLSLGGGVIDYVFDVLKDADTQKPHLNIVTANAVFDSVQLDIHSYSADWLYQAVMNLFNDAIRKKVQDGVSSALSTDVPSAINHVLATLPTKVEITGLPFETSFDYSIYTLAYVLVKGYGEVDASQLTMEALQALQQSGETTDTHAEPGSGTALPDGASSAQDADGGLSSAQSGVQRDAAEPASSVVRQPSGRAADAAIQTSWRRLLQHDPMVKCPFDSSPLPVTDLEIGADVHMFTLYVHENILNCLAWGAYNQKMLQYSLTDGTIPNLHITSDLLMMLIPDLPRQYPHQLLKLDMEALAAPTVSFAAATGVTVNAHYRLSISVQNDTLNNPKVATLAAQLSVTGTVDWDSIVITSVTAQHTVEDSTMPVPAASWDGTVSWFIQNYGGVFPFSRIVETFVHTPVTSMVHLINTQSATYDQWYALSSDVKVSGLPQPQTAA